MIIYEPTLNNTEFNECKVVNNLEEFLKKSDVILSNRLDKALENVKEKIYTRDLYTKD